MNCAQAERKIYLYEELTSRERAATDRHLATCARCQAAMERVIEERAMVKGLRRVRLPVPDHSKIKRGIMSHVFETHQTKRRVDYSFPFTLSDAPVRYAMAMLSIFLIVAFAREYNSDNGSQLITKHYREIPATHAQLNSDSFYRTLSNEKNKITSDTQSVYACLISCLQTPQTDCDDCGDKFSKLN